MHDNKTYEWYAKKKKKKKKLRHVRFVGRTRKQNKRPIGKLKH
jgi:hypothetical protein